MRDQDRQEVQELSHQWKHILYQVQIATGMSSVKLINLFRYPVKPFSARFKNQKSLSAMVELTDLKKQFKNKVISKTLPLQDLVFMCGHINNIQKYRLQSSKVFNYLICELALGNISDLGKPLRESDSHFIESESDEPFHFNYLVKDYDQYEVRYDVHFIVEDQKEYKHKTMMCSICGKRVAAIYCRYERKHFCQDCCHQAHSPPPPPPPRPESTKSSKITQPPKHSLEETNKINSVPLCEYHGLRPEYYCEQCQVYICDGCTQQTKHHDNPEHPLKPLQYVYQIKNQSLNTVSHYPKQKIKSLLQVSKQSAYRIQQNYERVKTKIVKQFEKALTDLQRLYHSKLIPIASDKIYLQMLLEKIDWTTAFVRVQQEQLRPQIYFRLHTRYEAEIERLKLNGFIAGYNAEPDMDAFVQVKIGKKEEIELIKNKENVQMSNSKPPPGLEHYQGKKEEKLLKYNAARDPPKTGQLTSLLQTSGIKFFRVQRSKQ